MEQKTINAIVTRYANYRDNDRILDLFTREQGMLSVVARGCRKPKSPLLGAGELFVYGEFVLFENKGRYSLDSCDIRESFYPLREDMDKFAAACYMLALINRSVTQRGEYFKAFELLYYALSYTAYTECAPLDIALCFAVKYLDALGYRPRITHCAKCGADLRTQEDIRFSAGGGAVCGNCGGGGRISKLSLEALRRMLLLEAEDMKKVVLPQNVRSELKGCLNEYAQAVLECELKPIDQL